MSRPALLLAAVAALSGLACSAYRAASKAPPPRAADPNRVLRILSVGDSNTWWDRPTNYRLELKRLLAAANIRHDFVGRQKSGAFEDNENEGYPGDGIPRIQQRISEAMIETYRPDIVLLLVGSNNLWVGLQNRVPIEDDKAQVLVMELDAILDEFGRRAPACDLIVAKPATPTNSLRPLEIYRQGIDTLVSARKAKGQRISAIDIWGLPNDGTHFTEDGYRGMAKRWFDEIVRLKQGRPASPEQGRQANFR